MAHELHELPRIGATFSQKFLQGGAGGQFFQKPGGTRTPFTVNLLMFVRDGISKEFVFFAFFYRILIKSATPGYWRQKKCPFIY
jgi:hypothetical protein